MKIKDQLALNRNNADSVLKFVYPYDKNANIYWNSALEANCLLLVYNRSLRSFNMDLKNELFYLIVDEEDRLHVWTTEELDQFEHSEWYEKK